ncbi:MAG: hypothetical protein NDJ89_14810 [Oligoflexia bacterium]|nr:hypothetical protein [Oligoflexia bacterium]
MLPIKERVTIATAVVLGMAALHPTDYKMRLWKLQYSMLKEVRETRSWGTLPVIPFKPPRLPARKGGSGAGR